MTNSGDHFTNNPANNNIFVPYIYMTKVCLGGTSANHCCHVYVHGPAGKQICHICVNGRSPAFSRNSGKSQSLCHIYIYTHDENVVFVNLSGSQFFYDVHIDIKILIFS